MAIVRRVGRPPLAEGQPAQPASTRLPIQVYDELCAIASREGVELAVVLRYGAMRLLEEERRRPISL